MATCGYICPSCEGRGITDEGLNCEWCTVSEKQPTTSDDIIKWMDEVHSGRCCGDLGKKEEGV